MPPVILLGLGFTTRRLAKRFLARGNPTWAAVRNPERFRSLTALGLRLDKPPHGAILVHTIPPLPGPENDLVRKLISGVQPRRIVYISTTGVYGTQAQVDETTPVQQHRRVEEEAWLRSEAAEALIVRAGAIYGPERGIHVRVREGRLPRAEPGGITSRIHADDLAALLEAGALSVLTGAWPVADDHPCPTVEVAEWCGRILRTPLPGPWRDVVAIAGRKVDGRKIRDLLGVQLNYPDYQSGILASLAEEAWLRRETAPESRC